MHHEKHILNGVFDLLGGHPQSSQHAPDEGAVLPKNAIEINDFWIIDRARRCGGFRLH